MVRHSRRQFLQSGLALAGLGLLAGCGGPPPATPQSARPARVGVLSGHSITPSPEASALTAALRDLGYAEGANLTTLYRFGAHEGLAQGAAELARQGVEVFLAVGDGAAHAARRGAAEIPVVLADSSDPIGAGLAASLARPGGNVTGLTTLTVGLGPKRLELLREAVPGLSRVLLAWIAIAERPPDIGEVEAAAQRLGVELAVARETNPMNLPGRLAAAGRADGLIVLTDAYSRMGTAYSVAGVLTRAGIPAVYEVSGFVQHGGLLSYGPNMADLFRRAASYVDKILRGARPADLPIEQPTRFDFVLNLKTARALGLTIPEVVLQQATEIIQ